jgi:hypothetical protein
MLPEDLAERVQRAFAACHLPDKPRSCHPLYAWLTHVSLGCTRLPPYLAPDLVRRLVQIFLDEPPKETFGQVCERCGLERPWPGADFDGQRLISRPDYWTKEEGCPHCHCQEYTWATRIDERHLAVLDGQISRKWCAVVRGLPGRPSSGAQTERWDGAGPGRPAWRRKLSGPSLLPLQCGLSQTSLYFVFPSSSAMSFLKSSR